MNVIIYEKNHEQAWNNFVEKVDFPFFFNRKYMEYHEDRFKDYSLLLIKNEIILALLPANIFENQIYSHQGLTFGGLICNKNIPLKIYFEYWQHILNFLKNNHIQALNLRAQPSFVIFDDRQQSILNLIGATLVKNQNNVIVDNTSLNTLHLRKKRNLKKSVNISFKIEKKETINDFWKILSNVLQVKHNKKPVHTVEEINFLMNNFPKNILHYVISVDNKICAGIILFKYSNQSNIFHIQYMAANDFAHKFSLLDRLIVEIFTIYPQSVFSFGISDVENDINWGLLQWKMEFGGRIVQQASYHINI